MKKIPKKNNDLTLFRMTNIRYLVINKFSIKKTTL